MKYFSLFILLTLVNIIDAQDTAVVRPCNQIPIANAETKASFDGKIEKFVGDSLKSDLKRGTHSAVFKLMIDCNGIVSKITYQSGTFSESNQKLFIGLFSNSKWKPAIEKSVNVTSFVFVTINIVNSKSTVMVQ